MGSTDAGMLIDRLKEIATSKAGMQVEMGTRELTGAARIIREILIAKHEWSYVLYDEQDYLHILAPSRVLLDLLLAADQWISEDIHITIRNDRQIPVRVNDKVNTFTEDFLAAKRIDLKASGLSIYLYDNMRDQGLFQARGTAPMRHIQVNDSFHFRGYLAGDPHCLISDRPFRQSQLVTGDGKDLGPVDAVYTWVDSSDPVWHRKFREYVGQETDTSHASKLRYLSRDELRFSLRSLCKFAPWFRKIFIVTDGQVPHWLRQDERLVIIDHRDIFPDPSVLPVFNSHAIESCLHRIPGLSENFVYFNDDVFLGAPAKKTDFFFSDGRLKTNFSGHLSFNQEFISKGTLATDAAFRNTVKIISGRFGSVPIAKVLHTPHPMKKSVSRRVVQENAKIFELTRASRIRSDSDANLAGNLSYYYSYCIGAAAPAPRKNGDYLYIDTGRRSNVRNLPKILFSSPGFFCINLTHHHEVSMRRQSALILLFLKLKFFWRSPFEVSFVVELFSHYLGPSKNLFTLRGKKNHDV